MNDKKQQILILLVISLVVISGSLVEAENNSKIGIKIGNIAPDFRLPNLQGTKVSLSDFRGQYVILNFWATWCPPCRQEMPHLNKFHQENKQFSVVAVNLGDSKSRVKEFMKYNDYQFPVLLDQTTKIGSKYQTSVIPTTYFLNPEGKIRYIRRGAVTTEQLARIKQIITDKEE